MTLINLENNDLSISISSKGAELQSIKSKNNIEYLWQGDATFWGRKSPVLFPIVGKLNNDKFNYESKDYSMSQHGFARDLEFTVSNQTQHMVTFSLTSSEKTKEGFPFDFILNITYTLKNNDLTVEYNVQNKDTKMMYFCIGAHPGFNVPINNEGNKEDYFIEFHPKTEKTFIPVTKDVLLNIEQSKKVTIDKLNISDDLFSDGVLIFETPGKNTVVLTSKQQKRKISVSYDNMPFLGIWSTYPDNAPFVCIEPWAGIADTEGFNDELSKKMGINSLDSGKEFICEYKITFE